LPSFTEHCTYSIQGVDEGDYMLSHVTQIANPESEQKKPDAEDVLLGLTNYC
jgi:hypothetical protein